MAIKTTCIQCQTPLSGPEDMLGKKIDCPACGTKNTLEPLEQRLNREREEEDKKQQERQRKRDLERLAFLHEIGQKTDTAPAAPPDDIALRETPHLALPPPSPPSADPSNAPAPAPPPGPVHQDAPERTHDLALIEDFAQAALVFAYLLAFLGVLGVVSALAFEEPLRPLAALFALMSGLVAFLAFKYLGELSRLLLHLARGQDRLLAVWSLRQQADKRHDGT